MIMKKVLSCSQLTFAALSSIFLTGCLFRPAPVPPRYFVLVPIPADETNGTPNSHFSVEIGFVKMPAYLLRDSIVVRTGPNEIEYLENALWGERLDRCFQRTLLTDLSQSLRSDYAHLAEAEPDKKSVRVFINVNQFDVDTTGRGRFVAQWRIVGSNSEETLKSGNTSLVRTGVPPLRDTESIAKTMSDLTAEFSHDLARYMCRPSKAGGGST
jgi:uncharacterized lipoprotein YmbA